MVICSSSDYDQQQQLKYQGSNKACNPFSDLVAELPFTLMHPKPEEEPEVNNKPALPPASSPTQDPNSAPAVDTNLIELDT